MNSLSYPETIRKWYQNIHSLSGKERANLLTQCLLILHEANVHIVSVTVDGATSNISIFCLEINNIFDLLNSRNRFNKNQSARCITAENYNEICEQGLFLCLQNVLGLSKILLSDDNFQYLLTYKLSQDYLETFFSAVRSRGGFNNNPNAKQFMSAYKRLLVHAEVDISKSANNIVLDETVVLNVSSAILVPHKDINNVMQDDTDEHDIYSIDKSDHDYSLYHNEWLHSDYVQDVVTYIAGFIARSVTKIIKCEICASYLIQDKVLSHLQKRKCRGGLISASENLVQTCLIAEKVFRIHNNVLTTKNIMSKLVLETIATIPSDVFKNETHLYDQSPMADHRKQLLEIILTKYFNLRLHHKSASKKDTIVRIRSMYTKLILFKNQ
ncbi:THAP domain-containing protein 9 [Trachymyrmex cornetzi]|uniref:THAP domain-containing protein 9 n=1 Tax=Trachymyrmex cornetzi TaxID=471704 RepID=A0A151JPH6_9HYME|nr:THAP domain-containing protein 9 [Trachymyrmex cornetzi]